MISSFAERLVRAITPGALLLSLASGVGLAASSAATGTFPPLPALDAIADTIEAGVWTQIPNSSIRQVLVTEEEAPEGTWRHGRGSESVIRSWNGAAFDGQRMYFHGGGHKAYGGNEVYAFDLTTLTWERLTEPTSLIPPTETAGCKGHVDRLAAPIASHTYDGFIYSPKTHSIFLFGWIPYCAAGWGLKGEGTAPTGWEFDIQSKEWSLHEGIKVGKQISTTAVYPPTGDIVVIGRKGASAFDPEARAIRRLQKKKVTRGDLVIARYDTTQDSVAVMNPNSVTHFFPDGRTSKRIEFSTDVPDAERKGMGEWGMAQHTPTGIFVVWSGGREVYTLDSATGQLVKYPNPAGPAPTLRGRVYSKWQYVPQSDVFVGYNDARDGVWVYRLPNGPQALPEAPAGVHRVCPNESYTPGCQYDRIDLALANAKAGDTISLAPGTYRQSAVIKIPGLKILGDPGAHLTNSTARGKAALVVKASDVVIEGIECSGIRVGSGNGACVRLEAPNITLRSVYFHDNQMHFLGGKSGGEVRIENSRFENTRNSDNLNHGVYVSRKTTKLTFINNQILRTNGQGHGLKCGAAECYIEGNTIAALDGDGSRAIDIPLGGITTIKNNILQAGPNTENADLIGIAMELEKATLENHSTVIEGNTLIFDRRDGRVFTSKSPGQVKLGRNVIVNAQTGVGRCRRDYTCGPTNDDGDNMFYTDRGEMGLDAYPALPEQKFVHAE